MKIEDKIVKTYLQGGDVSEFQNEWYFTNSSVVQNIGKNIFENPVFNDENKEKVKLVYETIKNIAVDFIPTNKAVWNVLFPNWKEALDDVYVDCIVGFPEPYDATVERDNNGKRHIIFDMVCWAKYVGKGDIDVIAQNLLTHELCHILIGQSIAEIDDDLENPDYGICLDAVTFHEGFAHLVSYEAQEIDEVDWHTETFEKVREKSKNRMKEALLETNKKQQEQNLYEALCGNYYDKFACMSGMLYLEKVWENGGNQALKEVFDEGYHGFAKKTID